MINRKHPNLGVNFGLAGVGLISSGILISGLAYRGRLGESYNPLNHFVSELGEVGVSPLAMAFNLGLVLGGACLLVSLLSLARRIGGWLGFLFGLIGGVCGVSGTLVGVFPMNNLKPHIFFATNFFTTGIWCMLLFSLIALFKRNSFPRWLALPGLLSMLGFVSFKFFPQSLQDETTLLSSATAFTSSRPEVWGIAIFEWLAVLGVIIWAFVVALALRNESRA